MNNAARTLAHFAARRITARGLRRVALLRFLPEGMVAMLIAEGLMLAWRELRKRPELRTSVWRFLAAKCKTILPRRA